MMEVTYGVQFNAAHRVGDDRLHGHRFAVDITVVGDQGADGQVVDHDMLEAVVQQYVLRFDGWTLLWSMDPLFLYLTDPGVLDAAVEQNVLVGDEAETWGVLGMLFVPSVENLAQYFANILCDQITAIYEVAVRATPEAAAARPQAKCVECGRRGEHTMGCGAHE